MGRGVEFVCQELRRGRRPEEGSMGVREERVLPGVLPPGPDVGGRGPGSLGLA